MACVRAAITKWLALTMSGFPSGLIGRLRWSFYSYVVNGVFSVNGLTSVFSPSHVCFHFFLHSPTLCFLSLAHSFSICLMFISFFFVLFFWSPFCSKELADFTGPTLKCSCNEKLYGVFSAHNIQC